MAITSTILIEETTAAAGKKARSALLIGSGLPYMGSPEWGSVLGITTTWYPGNGDEADQQVIGPQEPPATWQGGWHRTMLGSTPAKLSDENGFMPTVSAPTDLVRFLEGMFRGGRRLRVTWASEQEPRETAAGILDGNTSISSTIVREGRCRSFRYRPRNVHDMEWTMEWEWLGRGKNTDRVTSTRSGVVNQLGAAYQAAIAALLAASAAAQAAKFAPTPITLGQLQALANAPSLLANKISRDISSMEHKLGQVVDIAATVASQPAAIANMAAAHAADVQSQALTAYRELSGQGIESLSKKGDPASVLAAHAKFGAIQDSALGTARAALNFGTAVKQSAATHQGWLRGERSQAEQPAPGSVITVVVAKDGDTPQSLSQRFYNSPDHAVDILKANRLSWYLPAFRKGQQVVIPVLASASGGGST